MFLVFFRFSAFLWKKMIYLNNYLELYQILFIKIQNSHYYSLISLQTIDARKNKYNFKDHPDLTRVSARAMRMNSGQPNMLFFSLKKVSGLFLFCKAKI